MRQSDNVTKLKANTTDKKDKSHALMIMTLANLMMIMRMVMTMIMKMVMRKGMTMTMTMTMILGRRKHNLPRVRKEKDDGGNGG